MKTKIRVLRRTIVKELSGDHPENIAHCMYKDKCITEEELDEVTPSCCVSEANIVVNYALRNERSAHSFYQALGSPDVRLQDLQRTIDQYQLTTWDLIKIRMWSCFNGHAKPQTAQEPTTDSSSEQNPERLHTESRSALELAHRPERASQCQTVYLAQQERMLMASAGVTEAFPSSALRDPRLSYGVLQRTLVIRSRTAGPAENPQGQ